MKRVLVALAALCLSASPALAHAMLDGASPAAGSVVHAPPVALQLSFDQTVETPQCAVSLTDVSGNTVPLGPLSGSQDGFTLSAPIRVRLAPGVYQVHWRAVSAEGHITSGEYAFRVG